MKRKLQVIAASLFTIFSFSSKAQLVQGSIAPDFTFTDLNGNTQNLYSMLNAGKTVFIDISTAWCGPCWSYHTGGSLETLYDNYGPSGTNEVRVLYIEAELQNSTAQLNGIDGGTNSTSTYGNWITGTTYPMIDLSASTPGAAQFKIDYNVAYFPYVLMICPDRTVTEVGTASSSSLYASKTSGCSTATSSNDAKMIISSEFNNGLAVCDSVTPTFRFTNMGTSTLTSATISYAVDGTTQKVVNWSGSVSTYGNATITGVKLGATGVGNHSITATISNPNGFTDPTSNNAASASFQIYPSTGGAFISETFETSGIPTPWIINSDNPFNTWITEYYAGYNSTSSMVLNFYDIKNVGQVDYIKLPLMSFVGSTTASLSFYVSHAQYDQTSNDRLEVEVSIDCGETWTSVYNKSGNTLKTDIPTTSSFEPFGAFQWRKEEVGLNNYAGQQKVLVRFKGTSDYGNNLYIDDINFSSTNVTSIDESEILNSINLYPNPASENTFVEFNLVEPTVVSISVMNAIGQKVIKQNLGKVNSGFQKSSINVGGLENGIYFITINAGEKTVIKKLTINK